MWARLDWPPVSVAYMQHHERSATGDVFAACVVPIFAVSRSGGCWLVRAPDSRHPGSCAVIHRIAAIDEPSWIPRRPPSPLRLKRWFELAGPRVTHRYRVVARRLLAPVLAG
jgi:hypothetical protein